MSNELQKGGNFISLDEVVKKHLEQNKNHPMWFYTAGVNAMADELFGVNKPEPIITEDAEFEIIPQKQISNKQ